MNITTVDDIHRYIAAHVNHFGAAPTCVAVSKELYLQIIQDAYYGMACSPYLRKDAVMRLGGVPIMEIQ